MNRESSSAFSSVWAIEAGWLSVPLASSETSSVQLKKLQQNDFGQQDTKCHPEALWFRDCCGRSKRWLAKGSELPGASL